jgi:glutamate-ammonia-ligase adenylyltransferase
MSLAAGRDGSGAALARLGFADPVVAARLLDAWPAVYGHVLESVAASADPDLALRSLCRLFEASAEPDVLAGVLDDDERVRTLLVGVLAASSALGEHLFRHPESWRVLRDPVLVDSRPTALGLRRDLLHAVGADDTAAEPVARAATDDELDALRVAYRTALLALAARDLTGGLDVADVAGELADLAAAALEAALAIARAGLPAGSEPCRFAVIAMGKAGGRELNYVSDVDVVFVASRRAAATSGPPYDRDPARGGRDPRRAGGRPPRARCGRSTPRCGRRAGPGRWCGRSRATRRTTSGGRRRGSSRRC